MINGICLLSRARVVYSLENGRKRKRMRYQELMEKRDAFQSGRAAVHKSQIAEFEREFEIRYTHESTALEGNSMTLEETRVVLQAVEEGKDVAFCMELIEAMRQKSRQME